MGPLGCIQPRDPHSPLQEQGSSVPHWSTHVFAHSLGISQRLLCAALGQGQGRVTQLAAEGSLAGGLSARGVWLKISMERETSHPQAQAFPGAAREPHSTAWGAGFSVLHSKLVADWGSEPKPLASWTRSPLSQSGGAPWRRNTRPWPEGPPPLSCRSPGNRGRWMDKGTALGCMGQGQVSGKCKLEQQKAGDL